MEWARRASPNPPSILKTPILREQELSMLRNTAVRPKACRAQAELIVRNGHLTTMRHHIVLGLVGIGLGILAFLAVVATIVGIVLKALALVLLILAFISFKYRNTVRTKR